MHPEIEKANAKRLTQVFQLIDFLDVTNELMQKLKDENSKLSYDEYQKRVETIKQGLDFTVELKKEIKKDEY